MRAAWALAGILPILLAGSAEAALPPQAQRSREFQHVVEEAARGLAAPTDAVERVDAVLYRVKAEACRLSVQVVYNSGSEPSLALFAVVPGKLQCP